MSSKAGTVEPGPVRRFEGHKDVISSIATFPDGKRIATGSYDKTIRIWRLEDGKEVVKWVVDKAVGGIAVLRNGKHVVSAEGDVTFASSANWQLWVRDAATRIVVAGPLYGHTNTVGHLEISPDGGILASPSSDYKVILWDTNTWKMHGDPLLCGAPANSVQFSPSGCIAVATNKGIQIWDLSQREHHRIAQFKGHNDAIHGSLAWTHDGARLLSAGNNNDPVIRSWDASTWRQVGDPLIGHNDNEDIMRIVLNPAGTLLASASTDLTILWKLSTVDGCSLFSGGLDKTISQWDIPEDVLAAARGDTLDGELKAEGPSRGKQKNKNGPLDSEIPGQGRNKTLNYERLHRFRPQATYPALPRTDAECPSPTRLHGIRSFFSRIRPSLDKKGKQIKQQRNRKAPEVVDVPLAPATYRDYVASEEDGRRPYVFFFCLFWCQKKDKKPDLQPQVYDIDLMNAAQEEDILDVPIPTSRVKFAEQGDIELRSMTGQLQAVAGPSRLAETEVHPVTQSS